VTDPAETTTTGGQRRWGQLAPRTVEYEFSRVITRAREQLQTGVATGDPADALARPYVDRLRSDGHLTPTDPTARTAIEAVLVEMLVERGRRWNATLTRDGAEGPTPTQWRNLARMAVVRAFLDHRSWGGLTLDTLRKRLGDAVRERRRQRTEALGVPASVAALDEEQRAALVGFDAERTRVVDELRQRGATPPDQFEWLAIQDAVLDEVFSYRRLLEAYEEHAEARNLMVWGGRLPVYELADGTRLRGGQPVARDGDDLERMIQTLCSTGGIESKTWNQRHYELELSLPDGGRLTAVRYVTDGPPYVTIRRHLCPTITLADYHDGNHPAVVELLAVLMDARCSILVVGGMGSGKTTMLRALGSRFEPLEPVVVAESVSELRYHAHPDIYPCEAIPMLARRPGLNDAGGVPLADVITVAQRSNASRIVVGEIRGPEVAALLKAAQLGHPVLSTVHGHDAADGLANVARYHEQYTSASFENSLAQLCSTVEAVVTMQARQGRFVIAEVALVLGMKLARAGQPVPELDTIVGPGTDGQIGFVKPTVGHLSAAHDRRIYDAGIEHRVFARLHHHHGRAGNGGGSNGRPDAH
jgi:Flp pilus assembly CpaF family ATPase